MTTYKNKRTTMRPKTGKALVKKAIKDVKTQSLTKFIKQVVTRTEEKKVTIYQNGFTFGGGSLGSNIFPISPYNVTGLAISQGTGQGDRIGNKIRTNSLIMRYTIFPNAYNATTNPTPIPQNIRLWFFSVKGSNTLLATNPANFIQTGDSSTTLSGTVLDLNRIVNKDLYTYLGHRTHKLGFATYTGTGGNPQFGYSANNDYELNIQGYMNLTKMCPKIIKFNDTDQNPNSTLVQCLIECVNADGTSQTSLLKPCTLNYQLSYTYTDA